MPSFSATAASLRITGGTATFSPPRFSADPAVLRLVGGTASFSIGNTASASSTTPTLDRLTRFDTLLEGTGPSTRLQLLWQQTMEAIERAFVGQQDQITDLASIVARLEAAEAQASAAQAQATATATADALAKSYVSPVNIISATSAGVITIAAHTRIYGDGTSVAVNGGSISGFSPGSYVQIYYDDAGRVGGAVTYQGTTAIIAQEGARHIVGGVTIPAVGVPPYNGYPPFPPGYVPDPNMLASY